MFCVCVCIDFLFPHTPFEVYIPCSPPQLHTTALFGLRHWKQPVLPHLGWKNMLRPQVYRLSVIILLRKWLKSDSHWDCGKFCYNTGTNSTYKGVTVVQVLLATLIVVMTVRRAEQSLSVLLLSW